MERPLYLYIVLSRTNTGMGKIIRLFTRSRYNHVSLTLDPQFRSFVSFARYVQDVPLAGGFVAEPAERFLHGGKAVPVRIFRQKITPAQFNALSKLFPLADRRETGLIYNSLGAMLSTCHIRCVIPGCYTCLDFASAIVGQAFSSLQELEECLSPSVYYEGDLRSLVSDTGDRSAPYFSKRGFFRGCKDTVIHFVRLLGRIFRISKCSDPIAEYQKENAGLPV